MIKTIKTLIALAALSGTVGANAQAAEITVKKGDNLWNISKVHNTTVKNIKMLNNLSTNIIHPGDVLTVLPVEHYTVQQGDNLWDIGEDQNVTVEQLMEWNNLTTNVIYPGLDLVVFENAPSADKRALENQIVENSSDSASKPNTTVGSYHFSNANTKVSTHPSKAESFKVESTNTVSSASDPTPVKVQDHAHAAATDQDSDQAQTTVHTQAAEQTQVPVQSPAQTHTQGAEQVKAPVQSPAEAHSQAAEQTQASVQAQVHANDQTEASALSQAPSPSNVSKEITVVATAYTASCGGCSGITATGINLKQNPEAKVISVDPAVIPLGSKVFVEGYGIATAADTGGAIKGNRIDVFFPSDSDAISFGTKVITVKILN